MSSSAVPHCRKKEQNDNISPTVGKRKDTSVTLFTRNDDLLLELQRLLNNTSDRTSVDKEYHRCCTVC